MNNNFGLFLLFSVLVTGLIINPLAFAQDSSTNGTTISVNATDTIAMDESSNSTSTEMTESNSTSTEEALESEGEMAETEDVMEDEDMMEDEIAMEDEEETVASPLKQVKEGITPENIVCKEGLELVFKLNGQPACVKTTSIQKLIAWGWTQ